MQVCWAETIAEVRQAQRLRFDVFAGEMGAQLDTPLAGHDIDRFDDYCEHLLVRDVQSRQVLGTYRVLLPAQARKLGSTYCDGEFDLAPLDALRPRMAELGRTCVREGHRQGQVILLLWTALADFMLRNGLDTMIGCASIPLQDGDAAGVWRQLQRTHLATPSRRVLPRMPLPATDACSAADDNEVQVPALVRAYLRLGAAVLGPPAWDTAFNTADLLMMVRICDLPARYLRHANGG